MLYVLSMPLSKYLPAATVVEMKNNEPKTDKGKEQMGRLKSLGLTLPYQIPLLLPETWDDLTRPVDRFDSTLPAMPSCTITGRLRNTPSVRFDGAAPRLVGYLYDDLGNRIGFSAFGDTRDFQESLMSQPDRVTLLGQLDLFNGQNWLKTPEIISENWLGRIRPRYRGKTGVITPENVRERVLSRLTEAIPFTVEFLLQKLAQFGDRGRLTELAGAKGIDLETILYQAHLPRTVQHGEAAQEALQRLAPLGTIALASEGKTAKVCTKKLDLPDWRKRAADIPFPLTDEQERAIVDALTGISEGQAPLHQIIAGDVGTGKTAIFAVVAATVVDAGGTVACMLPNESLAGQVFDEITSWWPDLPVQLLTGSHREELCGSMVVGTSAILYRDLGDLDLVIVDELQKQSRQQREQLVGPNTHLLEATATCIPRSQALIRYGAVKVSRLTKSHTPKEIHTRIWRRNEWPTLYSAVLETLSNGDQVLMVYPLREKNEEVEPKEQESPQQKKLELRSAAEVFEKWEKLYPGEVRLIHGQMTDEEKTAALKDMRAGRASILCATTVVEVGLTIPKLRRVVVVHPERHGASTLHQIRGRLCRNGGTGYFDMFLPNPVKEATVERLQVLVRTTDGFEVAELDMMNRGVGDLSTTSTRQSGADMTFLFGKAVSIPVLDEMIRIVGSNPTP